MTSVTFHGGWFQETLLPWTEQDNEMIGHVGTYRLLLQNGRDIPSLFWGGCRVEGGHQRPWYNGGQRPQLQGTSQESSLQN